MADLDITLHIPSGGDRNLPAAYCCELSSNIVVKDRSIGKFNIVQRMMLRDYCSCSLFQPMVDRLPSNAFVCMYAHVCMCVYKCICPTVSMFQLPDL